jgi:hypothetical protein
MTLPVTPNPISLQAVATEFGGPSGAKHLEDYYAGGTYVPGGTVGYPGGVSTPIPTSGAISLQNFYGSSAASVYVFASSTTWTVPVGITSAQIILVGGGGGGGGTDTSQNTADGAGGGGAGGLIYQSVSLTPGETVTINIGSGGAGGLNGNGTNGGDTVAFATSFGPLTAIGGAGGGGNGTYNGNSGGSGGGGNGYNRAAGGGAGTAGQGNNGGSTDKRANGGGGGGAGGVGMSNAGLNTTFATDTISPGKGGSAKQFLVSNAISVVSGSYTNTGTVILAGGGGGGQSSTSVWTGPGGSTKGGQGGTSSSTAGGAGAQGGNGGGGSYCAGTGRVGGNGGAGIVFIVTSPILSGPVSTFDSAISFQDYSGNTSCFVSFYLVNDGTIFYASSPTSSLAVVQAAMGTGWYSGAPSTGIGASYWAYVTATGFGAGNVTGPLNTWVNLGTNQNWTLTADITSPPVSNLTTAAYLNIQIAASSGGTVLASGIVELSAYENG